MLKRLELKNCFKHAHRVIDFTTGLTAITGPNESGKSLIFEMIAYALFGSVALRGAVEDYKKMSVVLDFEVAGKPYRVSRASSKVLLTSNNIELATGTKTVNPAIVEILGYDFKVFNIANAANQDQLTRLGDMKPTERKQMVDNVIGLTIIDKLQDFVAVKCRELQIQTDTLKANNGEPVEPTKPEGYIEAGVLQKQINELSISEQRYSFLNQWLQIRKPVPVAPQDPGHGELPALMERHTTQTMKIARRRELEQQIARYTPPSVTADQIATMRADWEKVDQITDLKHKQSRLAPQPAFTKEQLDGWAAQGVLAQKWQQKSVLLAQGELTCPACAHHWPVAADHLTAYEGVEPTEMPKYIPTARDYAAIEAWNGEAAARTDLQVRIAALGDVAIPSLTKDALAIQERALADYDTVAAARLELATLNAEFGEAVPDYGRMITAQQIFMQQLAGYNQAVIEYNQWVADFTTNQAEFNGLATVPTQMVELRNLITAVAMYDHSYNSYLTHKKIYDNTIADIQLKSVLLNQYERVKVALKEARSTVKKYLVPSLNRVASALLSQMTGGARSHVDISEDFEITIDGQPLNTLSGSGKAVANLAIRIALGQVLIAKKFPVFMADEIDGSMDADRAEFTSECLRRLTKHVPQLLLISHKRPEADHYIELGR